MLVACEAVRPLTAGLQSLRGMYQTSWKLVRAGALIAAVAPVAVFFTLQPELIAGLTTVQPSEV